MDAWLLDGTEATFGDETRMRHSSPRIANLISRIYDIAAPHTSGLRPYSYGLQACNHTAAIVVQAWVEEIKAAASVDTSPACSRGSTLRPAWPSATCG